MNQLDVAYQNYFKGLPVQPGEVVQPRPEHRHPVVEDEMCFAEKVHQLADSDTDPLEHLCRALQLLTNVAWGPSWGIMTLETPTGNNPDELTLPCIVIDMNNREVQEKKSPKATLIRTVKESINGVETGDHLQVYRQWYDCVIEFNFYGRNALEARKLMHRFETLMIASNGLLKREGISEVFFLKEVTPKQSLNYVSNLSMKCAMYYYRFEVDYVVRTSTIKRIMLEMEQNELGTAEIAKDSDVYNHPHISYNL